MIEYAITEPGLFAGNIGRKALFVLGFYEPYAPGWGYSPVYIVTWITAVAGVWLAMKHRTGSMWPVLIPLLISLTQFIAIVIVYPKGERLVVPIHTLLIRYVRGRGLARVPVARTGDGRLLRDKVKPDVSVLMAVYNGEQHLAAAIDSILSQTHRNFELIVVDDGSTDRSAAIAASHRDDRIRLIRLPQNRGLSAALNEGLRAAVAPLTARQDADVSLNRIGWPVRSRSWTRIPPSPFSAHRPLRSLMLVTRPASSGGRSAATASAGFRCLITRSFTPLSCSGPRGTGGGRVRRRLRSVLAGLRLVVPHRPASRRRQPGRGARSLPRQRDVIIGAVGDGPSDYSRRFDAVVRELTTRQVGRLFGEDAVSDTEADLLAAPVRGMPPDRVAAFLRLFERLLARFQRTDSGGDFNWTLARQLDAVAFRLRPSSRAAVARSHPAHRPAPSGDPGPGVVAANAESAGARPDGARSTGTMVAGMTGNYVVTRRIPAAASARISPAWPGRSGSRIA